MESQDLVDTPAERGVTQYQRLASLLRHRIASGDYPLGGLLPTITQLAKELGVAVVTVRQAYEMLSAEGLVRSQRGRGTHVSAVPAAIDSDMRSAINDPQHISSKLTFDLHSTTPNSSLPDELQSDVDEGQNFTCVRKVHLMNGEPFCYAEIYIPTCDFERMPRKVAKQKKLLAAVFDLHAKRCKLIHQRTTVAPADFPLCETLKVPFASPVARMSRRVVDARGSVLYGSLTWYRGDRYVAEVEFPVIYLESHPGISEPKAREGVQDLRGKTA
jgi:GntR family transcriptional regulator